MNYSTDRLCCNSRELVIFDANIDNLQQLIDGIQPGINWEVLHSNPDGIQQITEILANRSPVETLHIVSHGAPGYLFLGNTQLSLDTLKYYTAQLQSWFAPRSSQVGEFAPLAPQVWGEQISKSPRIGGFRGQKFGGKKPSILLYGCNVAAGDAGEEFIQKLHQITQANIAASQTRTGNPQQGGNWNLEATVRSYKPELAFNSQTQATYVGVLETNLVKDINPGFNGSSPLELTVVGDKLFFTAYDNIHNQELWVSDGTEAGTNIVKDINPGSIGSSAGFLTVFGDKLFFTVNDNINGYELWVSDGTETGTNIVKDINPGSIGSSAGFLTVFGDKLFFTVNDNINGYELWVSDGTETGTNIVKEITPGSDSSYPTYLTVVEDKLFFWANGNELWISDGTEAGTNLVQDNIFPDFNGSYPDDLKVVGDKLFFPANDGSNGRELWVSDGTEAGTNLVKDIFPGSSGSTPDNFTVVGDQLFFTADNNISGRELWVSDGTEAGTNIVQELIPGSDGSDPGFLTVMGDQLFFSGTDNINGYQLWVSDGTEAGTNIVQDITPGSSSSYPSQLTVVGDRLFFTTSIGSPTEYELWVSDGTEAGTNLVRGDMGSGSSFPRFLTAVGDKLFFSSNGNNGGNEELWVSDGTEAGTNLVQDINASTGSYPDNFTAVGKKLFFSANDGINGRELWVSDINNPPVAISMINNTIAENEVVGTVVGSFSTTDADTTDNHTYTLVAGDGDTDNSQFEIVNGQLQTKTSFDFETKSSYTVRVQTNDGNGGTFEQPFTINVSDVNEDPTTNQNPTAIALNNNTIAENEASGTVVGSFSTTDADTTDNHTYTLVAGDGDTDNAQFEIVNGQLQTKASFDFETKSSYTVRVQTNDGNGGTFEQPFTINVSDVNEDPTTNQNPTAIALNNNTIAENEASGTVVGSFSTTDADTTDNHTYTLVAGDGDTDNAQFEIVNGQLQTKASFDFETKSSYKVWVQTDDGNGGTFAQPFTINVENVNEPGEGTITGEIIEDSPLTVAVTDPDGISTRSSYQWQSSADGTTWTDIPNATNDSFTPGDDQVAQFIRVNVSYTDNGGNPETVTVVASGTGGPVRVENVNDNPTAIALNNNTIAENEASGTVVGSFSTTDADTTDNHTYTLVAGDGDTDNAQFEIVNGQLQTKASFDFETKSSYTVRVQTNDGNGGTFEQPFTINVSDVNEDPTTNQNPTAIALNNNTIAENEASGTVVGSFSTTDADTTDNHTYTLVAGDGDTDNAQFEIVNGQLQTKASFDFETKSSYKVWVQTDDGNGGTFAQPFTINVENVNEPGEGTITGEIIEDSPLTVAVTDPDGISTRSSYQWQSSADGTTWTDIPNATNDSFTPGDDQVAQFIRVNVSYTDNGGNPETVTVVASGTGGPVRVENVNDNPTAIALNNNTIAENEASGTVVGSFSTTDADTTDNHTYTLVAGDGDTDNSQFEIVNGQLQTKTSFDFEQKSSYRTPKRIFLRGYNESKMPYSSSLTDREWEIIEPLLPKKKRTRPPKWSKREILNGILYPLKNGCNWCDLPADFPPSSTVYWHLHSVAS